MDNVLRSLLTDKRLPHVFDRLQRASGMSRESLVAAVAGNDVCLSGEVKHAVERFVGEHIAAQLVQEHGSAG